MKLLPVLVALAVGLAPASAPAVSFSSMVVFGDSLSDNGNNFSVGLYDPGQVVSGNTYIPRNTYDRESRPFGTYSNGYVWTNYFASALGIPEPLPSFAGGTNFSAGGAETGQNGSDPSGYPFSLRTQTNLYLTATNNTAFANTLYVVAGGGNNARGALEAVADPMLTDPQRAAIIASTAASYANDVDDIVDRLYAAGARNILVWNTPNIGVIPGVQESGPVAMALGAGIAGTMNTALAAALADNSGVTLFDLYTFNTGIYANPTAFGFENADDACGAGPAQGLSCDDYVFWDAIHPTTAGHRALAAANVALVSAVPEPRSWALLVVGFFVLGRQMRRRSLAAA